MKSSNFNVNFMCLKQANGPVKFNHVMDDSAIKDFGLMSDFIEWPDVTEEFFLPVQGISIDCSLFLLL